MIWVLQFMVVFLKLWPQQLSNQAIDLQVSYFSLRKCLLMDSCVQQLPLRVHPPHNPLLAPTTPPRNAAPGPTLHRSPIWCYLSRLLPIACSSLHPLRSPVSIVFPGDKYVPWVGIEFVSVCFFLLVEIRNIYRIHENNLQRMTWWRMRFENLCVLP